MKIFKKRESLFFNFWLTLFLLLFFTVSNFLILTNKEKIRSLFSFAQASPTCNPDNVNMTIDPNPAQVGSNINFSVSGTEGDIYIIDEWLPTGGVNCQGEFWGQKTCRALEQGEFVWVHKWRKCINSFNNCSDFCQKSKSFKITDTVSVTPTLTATPTPTSTPTLTPTPTLTQTPTPTLTPTPTFTPTPTNPFFNMRINLKLKFQGVNKKPLDDLNKLMVKITFKNEVKSVNKIIYKEFHANDELVWTSSPVETILPADNHYVILIKGPKHLQKKICHQQPEENSPGRYLCQNSYLELRAGEQNLDFSKIILLAGDLPSQDNVLNAFDLSLVRNNLGKKDREIINLADINFDGIVNTQDFSLLIFSMGIKPDEF